MTIATAVATALFWKLVASETTYFFVVVLAVWEVLRRRGVRTLEMGPMALGAVAVYIVSVTIITSYHHVDKSVQRDWWTISLLVVGLLYLGVLTIRGVRTEIIGLFGGWVLIAFGGAMAAQGEEADLLRKMFWVFQYSAFATMAVMWFFTVPKGDLIGIANCGILFIGEWGGVFQIVDCQFFHGQAFLPIVSGSACEAVYGWAGAPFVLTAVTSLMMLYPVVLWHRSGRP